MLHPLINRSSDLKRLFDDGYELSIVEGQLVVSNVPYVSSNKTVKRGSFVSELTLNNDVTSSPSDHVIKFAGDHPCDEHGVELAHMKHQTQEENIGEGIVVNRSFSCKPKDKKRDSGDYVKRPYEDYYEKITTYVDMVSVYAQQIDPTATARTHAVTEIDIAESPFRYIDNASGRAGISKMAGQVKGHKIGIVGLGGSGSYLLDLVAKSHVAEIHLFDGDDLIQHNAFRCPGAISVTTLQQRLKKVTYYANTYKVFRKGIVGHPEYMTEKNLNKLDDLNFVFLCIDKGSAKRAIVEHLENKGKSFIDVGLGVDVIEGKLSGIVRTSTSTPDNRQVFRNYTPFVDNDQENLYAQNIQIVELNALNACMAVIKWKKINGIYHDFEQEMNSAYTIDGNHIANEKD